MINLHTVQSARTVPLRIASVFGRRACADQNREAPFFPALRPREDYALSLLSGTTLDRALPEQPAKGSSDRSFSLACMRGRNKKRQFPQNNTRYASRHSEITVILSAPLTFASSLTPDSRPLDGRVANADIQDNPTIRIGRLDEGQSTRRLTLLPSTPCVGSRGLDPPEIQKNHRFERSRLKWRCNQGTTASNTTCSHWQQPSPSLPFKRSIQHHGSPTGPDHPRRDFVNTSMEVMPALASSNLTAQDLPANADCCPFSGTG